MAIAFASSLSIPLLINSENSNSDENRSAATSQSDDEKPGQAKTTSRLTASQPLPPEENEPENPVIAPVDLPEPVIEIIEPEIEPINEIIEPEIEPINLSPIITPPAVILPDDIPEPEHPYQGPDDPLEAIEEDQLDDEYAHIPDEVKLLIADLDLTAWAKKELYEHNPEIDETGDLMSCRTSLEDSVILGCWVSDKIYTRRLNDHLMKSSLAHELLHGIYYHAYRHGVSDEIDAYIDIVRQTHPEKTQKVLDTYADSDPDPDVQRWIEYNELHSFIGTEFEDIPAEFEEYYAQYFNDRTKILGLHHELLDDIEERKTEFRKISSEIQQQTAWHRQCLRSINHSAASCETYAVDQDAWSDFEDCLQDFYFRTIESCLSIKPRLTRFNG